MKNSVLLCFFFRLQEQLRRIKRNEEKEKVKEFKKVTKTPSDKPLKNVGILIFMYAAAVLKW